MLQTLHGILQPDGYLQMIEPFVHTKPVPVLIAILETEHTITKMSEQSLPTDWLREEEEEAWSHLQQQNI